MPYFVIIILSFLSTYISIYILFSKQKKPVHLLGLLISNILIFFLTIFELIIFAMGPEANCSSPCKIEFARLSEVYLLVLPLLITSLTSSLGGYNYFKKQIHLKKKAQKPNLIAGSFIIVLMSLLNSTIQTAFFIKLISITSYA